MAACNGPIYIFPRKCVRLVASSKSKKNPDAVYQWSARYWRGCDYGASETSERAR